MNNELNRLIGSKLLVDSMFKTEVRSHKEWTLEEFLEERLRQEMLYNISNELLKKFYKEIEVRQDEFSTTHTLEFFAFPKVSFKYIIEYIISQMSDEQIKQIRKQILVKQEDQSSKK